MWHFSLRTRSALSELWFAVSERQQSPRSVSLPVSKCCGLHEWPVFSLRGGAGLFANAAILALRAHAARIHKDRCGHLPAFAALRRNVTNQISDDRPQTWQAATGVHLQMFRRQRRFAAERPVKKYNEIANRCTTA